MTRSLLLDQTLWDLCLDADGNIAVAAAPYSTAQDVACAVRLFRGELWYDTTKGVPYFGQILGQFPPAPFMKIQFVNAALTVPGVTEAQCFLSNIKDRTLTGQLVATTATGGISVSFANGPSGLTTTITGG